MAIQTCNPTTEQIEQTFSQDSGETIETKLSQAHMASQEARMMAPRGRTAWLMRAAEILEERAVPYATLMAREMGKPVSAGVGEIKKCALVCRYYADHAENLLAPETVGTDAAKSYVRFDPLGVILSVMPWNFPFWQVFRCAAPAIAAGNVVLLKHASNVPQCALAIESVFRDAGVSERVFQNMFIASSQVDALIADDRVCAVTLTGSEGAGSSVASAAGKWLKKSVLELGGSDPFLVFPDCDLPDVAAIAATARLQNCGQTCVAAKRFILHSDIAEHFIGLMKKNFEERIVGDPLDEQTQMGPLASEQIREDLEYQVAESVKRGASIVTGGMRIDRQGFFYAPTILSHVAKGMPAYDEELFGPVAAVIIADSEEEMISIANDTKYGLGASIWTRDTARAEKIAVQIQAGFVAINSMVKSDPRLPFGGVRRSGYGRELAQYGIREFVNIKTVFMA